MSSKLFAALISLAVLSAAGCSSNADGGRATNAPGQRAASQPPAPPSAPASNGPNAPASATAAPAGSDAGACRLLTSEEIQDVQGEGVKATKGTEQSKGPLTVSQCFYETVSFANSVSLTLTKKNGGGRGEGPREFWKNNFGGGEREKEGRRKEGGEEEEEGPPPTRVRGVGDEAYWVGNQKAGALYVLKGDRFLRVSLGGADDPQKKIEKSKALAERALKRL
jgi:hypothetical protein